MKWGYFFLLPFLFYFTCQAGTQEEYDALASKYEGNSTFTENRGTYLAIFILDENGGLIAVEFRDYSGFPLVFFEKVDEIIGCVWKNPEIEKQEMEVRKNRGGVV